MALIQFELPYHEGAFWFERVRHLPWPMLLESGRVAEPASAGQLAVDEEVALGARFDIVVAEPYAKLMTRGTLTSIWSAGTWSESNADPFALLKPWLQAQSVPRQPDIPFAGGALGYWGYDLGRRIERLPSIAAIDTPVPDMLVGLYDWAIVVDHHLQRCMLVSHGIMHQADEIQALHARLLDTHRTPANSDDAKSFQVTGELSSNLSASAYAQAFEQVKAYIAAGDCYQINLAQRFQVPVAGDAWQAYLAFRQLSHAPFMAYMQVDEGDGQPLAVLSMSPERFLQVREGVVETRPIKGTRPRHADAVADAAEAAALANSLKDRAENLMIVDLLRNDIGKVCALGTVKVEALFRLQRFINVHHMVSIVRGQLAPGVHALDLLRGCFPGGSITGAPKVRAMEIIETLEPHRRHVYCGSIGYIGFDGSMDTNIAIRTSLVYGDHMTFYAGGGLVADSDCATEYQETLHKASQFFKLLAQLKQ